MQADLLRKVAAKVREAGEKKKIKKTIKCAQATRAANALHILARKIGG